MTYPVVFDEGSIIFNQNKRDVFDVFKSAIYDQTVRSVMDTNRKSINILSLSSIMFTSNISAPKEASLGRRMYTFEFSIQNPRTQEERDKFEEIFDSKNRNGPMKILRYIGVMIAIKNRLASLFVFFPCLSSKVNLYPQLGQLSTFLYTLLPQLGRGFYGS